MMAPIHTKMEIPEHLNPDKMRESLADYAHDAWSRWMNYLFSVSTRNEDGTVTIPKWAVDRWVRQMSTPYMELPEEEKESDRKEADRVVKIVGSCGTYVKELGSKEEGEGWYVDHPEFYFDAECEDGLWSVYFRHRASTQELYSDREGTIKRMGRRKG